MMAKIGTKIIREKLGEILNCVNLRGDEFIIIRKSKPLAALISVRKLQAIKYAAKKFIFDFLDSQEEEMTQEEIDELIEEAKKKSGKKSKK